MWCVEESKALGVGWPPSPPPPWPAAVRATLWWHRATPAAAQFGPGGKTLPLTLAMVVDYVETPVGPYREILASPVLRLPGRGLGPMPRMAVPFIAVDSEMSAHGGRTHWHLPKVLAEFGGNVLTDASVTADGWSVLTRAHPKGPVFPIVGKLGFAQPTVDGSLSVASTTLKGKARFAMVDVKASGPTFDHWLTSGRHFGLQIVSGKMTTGVAGQTGRQG